MSLKARLVSVVRQAGLLRSTATSASRIPHAGKVQPFAQAQRGVQMRFLPLGSESEVSVAAGLWATRTPCHQTRPMIQDFLALTSKAEPGHAFRAQDCQPSPMVMPNRTAGLPILRPSLGPSLTSHHVSTSMTRRPGFSSACVRTYFRGGRNPNWQEIIGAIIGVAVGISLLGFFFTIGTFVLSVMIGIAVVGFLFSLIRNSALGSMFRKKSTAQSLLKQAQKAAPKAFRNVRPPSMPSSPFAFGKGGSIFDLAGMVMRSVVSPEVMQDVETLKREALRAVERNPDASKLVEQGLGGPSSVGEQVVNSQRAMVVEFVVATRHGPGRLRVRGEGKRGDVYATAVELEVNGRQMSLLQRKGRTTVDI